VSIFEINPHFYNKKIMKHNAVVVVGGAGRLLLLDQYMERLGQRHDQLAFQKTTKKNTTDPYYFFYYFRFSMPQQQEQEKFTLSPRCSLINYSQWIPTSKILFLLRLNITMLWPRKAWLINEPLTKQPPQPFGPPPLSPPKKRVPPPKKRVLRIGPWPRSQVQNRSKWWTPPL
jgi:hypothetical protein